MIEVLSPTRVDLAGGTLDLWPLYLFVGGASTVNVAINIFTRVELRPLSSQKIRLFAKDLKAEREYPDLISCLNDSDERFKLLRSVIRYWQPAQGFELSSESQSPVGGGLGGSSSLTISLMKAFSSWQGRSFSSVGNLVQLASNIEAEVLNTPTGTQDYYPAASGGINILEYGYEGAKQELISVKDAKALNDHFMLIYTGKSHHSGLNNFEVMKKAIQKDPSTMKSLGALKEIASRTAQVVRSGSWLELPALFREEYKARVELEPSFSGPEILRLSELSLRAGAEAVKICGAGGGGCVLVWAAPDQQKKVETECQKQGFQILPAKVVDL